MSDQRFDFIVVGAGSAGCVLAARLSENPDHRVLLLEAGSNDWNPLLRVPIMAGKLFRWKPNNWAYWTEPEPNLDGRKVYWPRGRVMGGSSSINGMIYARGNRRDYDDWAQTGLVGWSYERCLPYFKRSENYHGGAGAYHGGDGPLPVTRQGNDNPLFEAFLAAGVQAGYRANPDFNGAEQEGVGRYDYNIKGGQRWSAARSYLDPVRSRPNLTVLPKSALLRVTLNHGRATGVEVLRGGARETYLADREIVLSCGAINSPAALLHSGIGEPDELTRLGIKPEIALPAVGRNLQDHYNVRVVHQSLVSDGVYEFRRVDRTVAGIARSALFGTGPASFFPSEGGAFLRTDPALDSPDIQIHLILGGGNPALRLPFARPREGVYDGPAFTGNVCQLRPESTGRITLKTADPLAPPAIHANYLATENDRRTMREGVKVMRAIFRQPALNPYRGREFNPGPGTRSDADLDEWIAASGNTIFHPVGTCKMGVDDTAVVDAELRVRGVEGLRVADASVMPRIVSANTHAATVMIAERAAEMMVGAK